MKLYHNPLSPNCRRVTLTAAYLGIPYEEEVLDLGNGEHKSTDYMGLNPNGMIPTLVDGDFKLWESRGIVQYLASKKPESGLLGRNDNERADIARWQNWDAAHLARHVGTILWEKVIKGMFNMGDTDQAAVDEATGEVRRFFAVLDSCLAGQQYLVGDTLTVADLTVAATLTYAEPLQLPVSEFQNLRAWLNRITALDAWKQTQPQM
jgi:glutathione S-transferase